VGAITEAQAKLKAEAAKALRQTSQNKPQPGGRITSIFNRIRGLFKRGTVG
jgi:hypothetical protein